MFCCYEQEGKITLETYDQEGEFYECRHGKSRKNKAVEVTLKGNRLLLYTVLTANIVVLTILSNLAAIKITSIMGLPIDCGFICYPITFLLTDVLNRKFGLKTANLVTVIAVLSSLMVSLVMSLIVVKMASYASWAGQTAFAELFNFGLRVTIASAVVYLVSHILDSVMFSYLEKRGGTFVRNSFKSSLIAQTIDSILFITIAFFGALPVIDFIKQIFCGTVVGLLMQVFCLGVCALIDYLTQ